MDRKDMQRFLATADTVLHKTVSVFVICIDSEGNLQTDKTVVSTRLNENFVDLFILDKVQDLEFWQVISERGFPVNLIRLVWEKKL